MFIPNEDPVESVDLQLMLELLWFYGRSTKRIQLIQGVFQVNLIP